MRTSKEDMDLATAFLRRFGHLEAIVRRLMEVDERIEFSSVLREFRRRLPRFAPQIDIMDDLSKLRNLVAHGNDRTGKVIPTVETSSELDDVIVAAEGLTGNLSRFFKQVHEFEPSDSVVAVLREMNEHNYSQVAVRVDGKLDVLTAIDITLWLASQASAGIVSIEDATVEATLNKRNGGRFAVMPRSTTVAAAAERFFKAVTTDYNNLFCILITQTGKAEESPLGIITLWDLLHVPKLMHSAT